VREGVFSLSQPGGHPRNWNAVLAACLQPINTITQVTVFVSGPEKKSLIRFMTYIK
jgi:hypothetical protein